MIRIHCIVEGQTEEAFFNEFLRPIFLVKNIFLTAGVIQTSPGFKGGGLEYSRVKKQVSNLLKSDADLYVSTFFDLYALKSSFPNHEQAFNKSELYKKVEFLEESFKKDICSESYDLNKRFFPHIQPYEFEALLFSDITKLLTLYSGWKVAENDLLKVRKAVDSPEYINNTRETRPTARLEKYLCNPKYSKVTHGAYACKEIGLEKILSECQHFRNWYNKILALQPLDKE